MNTLQSSVLCRYRYDALDRLVNCMPPTEATLQRFFCKNRLSTEIQGSVQRMVFQEGDHLLAQKHREGDEEVMLLGTDSQRSVTHALNFGNSQSLEYTPYGHRRQTQNSFSSFLGFNGECPDPVTGNYLLGNGYRAFNPVLMRFNSPDSWSPFGKGGLNAYAYCSGDPVNFRDPTGHMRFIPRLAKTAPRRTNVGPVERLVSRAKLKEVPAKNISSGGEHPSTFTGMGTFDALKATPHIPEEIIKYLSSKDLKSLSKVSSEVGQMVGNAKARVRGILGDAMDLNVIDSDTYYGVREKVLDIVSGVHRGLGPSDYFNTELSSVLRVRRAFTIDYKSSERRRMYFWEATWGNVSGTRGLK